jgi:hypothetical protein
VAILFRFSSLRCHLREENLNRIATISYGHLRGEKLNRIATIS